MRLPVIILVRLLPVCVCVHALSEVSTVEVGLGV
jgi:hypothetical protein